tara:strand:+ start:84 stop:329 length:246 start_codon:yes stop_codon:yes gene_type:complete
MTWFDLFLNDVYFVTEGNKYRIFKGKLFWVWTYYILEDSSKSSTRQGVEYNVKLTTYFFKTLSQVVKLGNNLTNEIGHKQL